MENYGGGDPFYHQNHHHPHLHPHPEPQPHHHHHHHHHYPGNYQDQQHNVNYPQPYQQHHLHQQQQQYYYDQNNGQPPQFNHGYHQPNPEPNHQMPSATPNEVFNGGGGGFGYGGGRKRGRFHSDHNDGAGYPKLYVAPVPRTTTVENIRPLFEEHGTVIEVVLLRDKRTGQQQEYCFVKYATVEEADRAISALNNQYTCPGEMLPLKVRYADGEKERLTRVEREHQGPVADKLYVGSVNKQGSKQEIQEIFSHYGHVEDIYVKLDEQKQARCAFVKFSQRDMALAAIKGLNGTFTMRGCDKPLIVRFAEPKKPRIGELRGNYVFGGPNFSMCSQDPNVRPAPNFADSTGGPAMPNASYPMQSISANSQPQPVNHTTNWEHTAPCISEQPIPPLKQSPSQLPLMPSQHTQSPQRGCQSSQQAAPQMQVMTMNLEHQHNTPPSMQEAASGTSAEPAIPPSPLVTESEDCDWSEHRCPDGVKYYYNSVTCESRWEKPKELTLFEQQIQNSQKLMNPVRHPSPSLVSPAKEVNQTQKALLETDLFQQKLQLQHASLSAPELDHLQMKSETSTVVDPTCV